MTQYELQAAEALKFIARNEQIKTYLQSSDLYPLLHRAAKRFVSGETRDEAISRAKELMAKGYVVSLEYIGENTRMENECASAKNELITLIHSAGECSVQSTISFDLSHIGMSIDPELALHHLVEIAKESQLYGLAVMISMEESAKTNQILSIYKNAVMKYPNIGITLQAHLYGSDEDIKELLNYPGRIRLVKGAYQEPTDMALPRSKRLDQRYLQFADTIAKAKHPLSIASHDAAIIEEIQNRNYLEHSHVEVEMLYGVQPQLLKELKDRGYRSKVYLTYGQEWYLYLCHRLAEYPPNIYVAIADMIEPNRAQVSPY